MNLTLLSLITYHQTMSSPFISMQNANSVSLSFCSFSKHFQSLLNLNYNSQILILNSKFSHFLNSAVYLRSTQQTLFLVNSSSSNKIKNVEFENCHGFRGGAVHSEIPHLDIINCRFINNSGNYGAAVYVGNIEKGSLTDSLFTQNSAKNLGAGYFLDFSLTSAHPFPIKASNFTHQTSVCVGAIECWGGVPIITHCHIDHCKSTFGLPAVRTSSVKGTAILNFDQFTNCSSRQFGAVFQSFVYKSSAHLKACLMADNWCLGQNGTTVYIQNTNVNVVVEDCIIHGEKERQFGGVKKMEEIIVRNTTFVYDHIKDAMKDTPAPTMSQYPKY